MNPSSRRQRTTPIYEMLKNHAYQEIEPISLHVPGHKSGTAFPSGQAAELEAVLPIDLTELPHLDDLHQPAGAIEQSQRLAAECFGADDTFYLVGGSTAGNVAFILSVCKPGDTVLVERNAHKSILNGLMLAEATAVFLPPNKADGIGPDAEQVRTLLGDYPDAKALILTCPNYYGAAYPLGPLISAAHDKRVPVYVDEAHGAHFGLHPALPKSAMSQGADVVVQSTHKMLPSMTMSSMLHIQGSLAPKQTIAAYLRMLQSSSPSYPLMASLDLARSWAATDATGAIAHSLAHLRELRRSLEELGWIGDAYNDRPNMDPYKLTLYDRTGTLNGFQLQQELGQRGIYAEMADPEHVLLLFPLIDHPRTRERFLEALADVADKHGLTRKPPIQSPEHKQSRIALYASAPKPVRFRRPAATDRISTADIPLEQAEGAAAAELVIPYPPGIPMLIPGELISPDHIEALGWLAKAGGHVQGLLGPSRDRIRIILQEGDHNP